MVANEPFWWGTAASSTQTEGPAPASDWAWMADLGFVPRGSGNGFASQYRDDFALYASHGLAHHRLSIEWARVEPEPGRRDEAAVEHYRNVLRAARQAGVSPWVCLLHFTTPRWFSVDQQGFVGERNRALESFGRHVEFVAETFGDLVAGWQPINEPHAFVTSYLAPQHPELADPDEIDRVLETVHLAAAQAASTLRKTGGPVATIHNLIPVFGVDDTPETAVAVDRADRLIWRSWNRSDLLEPFDLLGFSYYHGAGIGGDGGLSPWPPGQPVTAMGYAPWPSGLRVVLDRLGREQPLPILVAELGIGTDDDTQRQRYLTRALDELAAARAEGTDVRGCFFWTGVDNDEWLHGDSVPFGLFDRDRSPRGSLSAVKAHIPVPASPNVTSIPLTSGDSCPRPGGEL